VWRSVANVAVNYDQRWPIVALLEFSVSAREHVEIIGVADASYVPSVADETSHHIFAERPVGGTVERDAIVIVDPAEIRKLQMSGERSCFAADAFHDVAVAADGVNVEIEKFKAGAVECCAEPLARNRHAYAVSSTLSQRAGCRFYSGR